jgi:hypothetical protein
VQFPFSAPIYFCYVAPLAVLTLSGFLSCFTRLSKTLLAFILAFYLLFAVTRIRPGFIFDMEESYKADIQTAPLHLERAAGLRVTAYDADLYERLIALVREHATGRFIYAAPDCPEVYFLSGFHNPTRSLFEFLDSSPDKTGEVLSALKTHQVTTVVIFNRRSFSGRLPDSLRKTLVERFPSSSRIGAFEVRWTP